MRPDVLKAALVVVPAEQQRAGSGQRAGDCADDRLARLSDLVFLPAPHRGPVGIVQPLEDHRLHPDRRPRQPLAHDVGLCCRRAQRPRRRQLAGGEHGLQRGPAPPVRPAGRVRGAARPGHQGRGAGPLAPGNGRPAPQLAGPTGTGSGQTRGLPNGTNSSVQDGGEGACHGSSKGEDCREGGGGPHQGGRVCGAVQTG